MNSLLTKNNQTAIMLALEKVMATFEQLPLDTIKNFWNPEACRVDLLPYLAICVGVTLWDDSLTEKQKREACKNAILINKQKGTVAAIKRALKALGLNSAVIEWWQNNMPPMTAQIILQENEAIFSDAQYEAIYKLVSEVKRLSLHVTFVKQSAIRNNFYIAGSFLETRRIRIA